MVLKYHNSLSLYPNLVNQINILNSSSFLSVTVKLGMKYAVIFKFLEIPWISVEFHILKSGTCTTFPTEKWKYGSKKKGLRNFLPSDIRENMKMES